MRALVPIAIVAIIAVVVLILVLSDRRKTRRRAEFKQLNDRIAVYRRATGSLNREVNVQVQAGVADLRPIQMTLSELSYDLQKLDDKDRTP